MILLPSLKSFVSIRPHSSQLDSEYLIPDLQNHSDFWDSFYQKIYSLSAPHLFSENIDSFINEHYGYFGERMHPVTFEPQYFHMGIELNFNQRQKIKPLFDGILEYSGFGVINGYYILLSHPQIQTEDGYVLHTMYCHLKKPLVKFSSYQKMLREISLNSYPLIEISKDTLLGFSGKSGLTNDGGTQCYIQCDFRKFGEDPIVINPISFYSKQPFLKNLSEKLFSKEKFLKSLR